jgi:hypothetical protein
VTRAHQHQDVYVDGKIAFTDALVIEDPAHKRLAVRQPRDGRPFSFKTVAVYDSLSYEGSKGDVDIFKVTTEDNVETTVGLASRQQSGCRSCAGKRR